MNTFIEYNKKAERLDLYTILGCHYKDSRDTIKTKFKALLKLCHPDKTDEHEVDKAFQIEFFGLVKYAFKVLHSPLLRIIYNCEGHYGLKIFHNMTEDFEKILSKFPTKALDDENDENFVIAVEKILKKMRKIKFDLIKTNLHKYTNDKQKLISEVDLSGYLNYANKHKSNSKSSAKKSSTDDLTFNKNNNFLDTISNSSTKKPIEEDKFYTYSKKKLIRVGKISVSQMTLFKPDENVSIKVSNRIDYDIKSNKFELTPKISGCFPFEYKSHYLKTKSYIDTHKKRLKCSIFSNEFKRFPLFQKPFIRSYYKYDKKRFTCSLGNKYKDEACKVKASLILPKSTIKLFFQTYLRDAYYSIIGFNLRNLTKLNLFYKGFIKKDIEVISEAKICMRKNFKMLGSVAYKISDNFKLQVVNQLSIQDKSGYAYYNIISIGFQFRAFTFRIPLVISKLESSSSLGDIMFYNILVNGFAYSLHIFKKLLF